MERSIEIKTIYVNALTGLHLDECIKDAVALSLDKKCCVRLLHDNKIYVVGYNSIIASISEEEAIK